MSHLHIPDGLLPNWLVLASWIVTAIILAISIYRIKREDIAKKIPLIGIISALMIVCMTLPVIPFAYHVNLSIVAGIILGPALAFIAIFIVDLLIAMFGHGGITVVGLNTVVIGAEAVLGYYLYRSFLWMMGNDFVGWSSGIAAVLSLILSTSLLVGALYLSQLNPGILLESDTENPAHTSVEESHSHTYDHSIDLGKFARAAVVFLSFGWILEGIITGLVIRYISGVRPDLLPHRRT